MENHTPLTAPAFNGVFARGKTDNVPSDHFIDCLNVKLKNNQIETRDGIDEEIVLANIKRVYVYRRTGEASRYIILNSSGSLYDSTNTLSPILTIALMTDFSATTLYGRVYLTPHDGVTGLAGEEVYLYDGSTCRKIAGSPPAETAMSATEGDAGNVEAGTHAFAYCYETSTGFITAPGGYVSLVSAGNKKVDLADVTVGPSGTIARHIIATHILDDFAGDFVNQAWYFVPDGVINDNTTTTIEINFYEGDLFESADYLFDQLSEVPAGVGIATFGDRLITWGENLFPNIVRASYPLEPEAFDEIEGYLSLDPGDGGGNIKNTFVQRDVLYILKDFRAYATTDNGENAAYWNVDKLEGFLGAYPHSIGNLVEDSEHILYDRAIVGNPAGLWLFAGIFPEHPLSWKIADIWDRINKAYFHLVQVAIDPYQDQIYINVPLDANTTCEHLLVCDFENGLDPENVKWSIWTFPYEITSIFVDINYTTKKSIFKFGSIDGNVYEQEEGRRNDNNLTIPLNVRFAYGSDGVGENHFAGTRIRAVGNGNLDINVYSLDDVSSISVPALSLSSTQAYSIQRKFNFISERASVKLSQNEANEWARIVSATLYAKLLWNERPEL